MKLSASVLLLLPSLFALGCGSSDDSAGGSSPSGKTSRDSLPDGLYHDFLDGKFDGTGHPLDSQVWQAESECQPETGKNEAEGRGVQPERDASGIACSATSKTLGVGRFTLNARALVTDMCEGASCDSVVLELSVLGDTDAVLETKSIVWRDFSAALTYKNASVAFTNPTNTPVKVRVSWPANVAARLDYVELFRSTKNLLITPPSSILDPGAVFSVEALDPPAGATLTARCDDLDLTPTLDALSADGSATREDTDFRAIYSIPADALLANCPRPTRVRFSIVTDTWVRASARVTIYDAEPACAFTPGTKRVLLTGFEPFPADSSSDNSSNEAVQAFDETSVPGISLMRLTLPVEYATAAGIVADVVSRCDPDVIVGFGQGRSEVDLETTAYNLEDSSDFAGGFPDNRGHIGEGELIVPEGPPELSTRLPTTAILDTLVGLGIPTNLSDDPGRYVCNDIFYRIMTESEGTSRVSGFVHLPRIASVGDTEREMLKTVVRTVVASSISD